LKRRALETGVTNKSAFGCRQNTAVVCLSGLCGVIVRQRESL
jgi:hypothetical protein